ncbi:MAG: hypothetical protein PHU93_00445 [Candidatus Gracilibacteria bacterium]|nr:hypothetical protein [Candidatus Gracilibacteria bacterium]
MNGTGVVGYIALLMICGSILGGDGQVNFGALRADALSSNSFTTSTREPLSVSVMSRGPKGERYVRIFIDGIPYEGTLHANGTNVNLGQ